MMKLDRRKIFVSVAASVAVVLVTLAPSFGRADQAARALVTNAGERLIQLIRSEATQPEKEAAFLQLMDDTSAVSAIARTALGAPWRSMSDQQKARYEVAFRRYLARNYVARFRDYTGEKLTYVKTTENNKGFFVETLVGRPGEPPFQVVWRLKEIRGDLKIVDIKAESLSLLATEREILTSLLDQNGGNFDAFLDALEQQSS